MERSRKCILCETVHASRQEMDEHMRSMLHHRELEKLKGRDCGHECRVCKVTVVSLTDYASHISSPTHKQKAEAAEQKQSHNEAEEDYFDQGLVDLIDKRKEQIRKEKEAAALKRANEEEEQRKTNEFHRRLKEAQERFQLECDWSQPSNGFSGSNQYSWYNSNQYNAPAGQGRADYRPWQHSKQGKSATWHAQQPPNFHKWASGEFSSGSLHNQERWNNRQWDQGMHSGGQKPRLPWLSNGGSSNGIYGRNNISQYPQRSRPLSLLGPPSWFPSPPKFFAHQFPNTDRNEGGHQGDMPHNGEQQNAETDHHSSKTSKAFGSNSKLDKVCRWSPYPVTKGLESTSHNHANSSEKNNMASKPQKQEKAADNNAFNRKSRPEQKPGPAGSGGQSVAEKWKHKTNLAAKSRDRSSSGSRSSSAQRESQQFPTPSLREGRRNSSPNAPSQKTSKPAAQKDKKLSSVSGSNSAAQISKTSSQVSEKVKSKHSGLSAPPVGLLQSRHDQQIQETLRKARQIVLEKKASLESSLPNRAEATQQSKEEQQRTQAPSGINKENSCRQRPALPESIRLGPHGKDKEKVASSDSNQSLQSLQVSTSTEERLNFAAPSPEDEERRKREREACADEAMQGLEVGQGSESDTSRGGEAQAGPNASGLSKLDLPPVLKRDLTKHMSSKAKVGVSHEPNLNIARRVRNLSGSRKNDADKDSGLKPTVRQLISSCGSRRNVNWDQVYQEVRKKQDKGKGMPRFGIEMVPCDQEDHSQEEDDLPLLQGFQWESLMDMSSSSASATSRKRSLSESSIAPMPAQSLFPESLTSDLQRCSGSPRYAQGTKEDQAQQDLDLDLKQMFSHSETIGVKQEDGVTAGTARSLQRSDSALGDSSSGTELCDGQGTGKKRRATREVPNPETSGLEHNNKRRKIKPKKERLQIDQLLAVSLREEELSRSLQTLDTNLIQARAALEAALMEVQRLMVAKQQMTTEMSTLRNKRIELLKGMQGTREESPVLKLKEEKVDSFEVELVAPPSLPSSTDPPASAVGPGPAAQRSVPSPNHCAQRASPPSSSLPFMPVSIKQEPQSPVHVSSGLDADEPPTLCAHSTTPELPSDLGLNLHPSTDRKSQLFPTKTEHEKENFGELMDCKESLSGLVQMMDKEIQAGRSSPPDSKSHIKLLSPSRRGSEVGGAIESTEAPPFEPPPVPSVLHLPASPGNGKRVRKLKKRKVLKKAQGAEQPESSDTELDAEALRPRWLRPRRRSSGGSQVSTSTLQMEDREGDMNVEETGEAAKPGPEQVPPPRQMGQVPQVAQATPAANQKPEESMEVTAATQQPTEPEPVPVQVPDSSRPEPQNVACNEVSSTSDMDISPVHSSDNDVPIIVTMPNMEKASSDASSDHGEDDIPTEGVFEGHAEAVNAIQIHNGLLYTCSGDRTVRAFDLVSHKCVGVFEGHSSKVNCLLLSTNPCLHHRLYTGSSDQTIRCYSLKQQKFQNQFSLSDRVLCLHSRWKILYAGLGNGTVVTFNLKINRQVDVFECHGPRAVSCLATSQEGTRRILLVGSYDSTISVRDAKNGLLLRTLEGHSKTVLCMKVVNDLVFSGSSDQSVYAHNMHSGELMRVYQGHTHAVSVVAVLGKVMVTACLDKLVRVYDLQSHELLQVYGGHKDMVMCMNIHKNMIYTGCYNGSVHAVKLNLMQNYRCRWHGCSLVFGVLEHLQDHLLNDHATTNVQTLRCRWKNCEEFFCTRNSSKQTLLLHMQKHTEEETEPEP